MKRYFAAALVFALSFVSCKSSERSPADSKSALSNSAQTPTPSSEAAKRSLGTTIKKVFIVVLENTNYDHAITQPFQAALIKEGALLTNYYGLARPSQPNYFALISGSTHGVKSNDNVDLTGKHIGDLLKEKGLTWKSYTEDYPGDCFSGEKKAGYSRKHQPFISFRNVRRKIRCENIVNSSQLQKDVDAGALPDFSLYIPNNNNSGHDTGFMYADQFLQKVMTPLIQNPKFMKDMLFIVTYDEGANDSQHIATILYGAGVKPGSSSAGAYSHYNLLRTIEDRLGLDTLGQEDAKAEVIKDIWQ